MKKFLQVISIICILLILPITSYAAKDKTDTYEYEVENGKAVLTRYATNSNATRITIPTKVDNYEVIGLKETFKENQKIKEITIPNKIEFLGNETFLNCKNLEKINLPNTLKNIGNKTFKSCIKLYNINLPNSLIEIGWGAFNECDLFEEITIPSNVEIIKGNKDCYTFSGKKLWRIINKSNNNFDEDTFIHDENFDWYATIDNIKKVENIPANSTIYRSKILSDNNIQDEYAHRCYVYLAELYNVGVGMEYIKSEGDAIKYITSNLPSEKDDNLKVEVMIAPMENNIPGFKKAVLGATSNDKGEDGYFSIWVKITNTSISNNEPIIVGYPYIPIWATKKISEDSLENDYAFLCYNTLVELSKEGISMRKVNSQEEAIKYVRSKIPETINSKLNIEVMIAPKTSESDLPRFKIATAGTILNPKGEEGTVHIWVKIKNTSISGNDGVIIGNRIPIIPITFNENLDDSLETEYAKKYYINLENIPSEGISMNIVNTKEQAIEFIKSKAPDNKNENLSVSVEIAPSNPAYHPSFREAIKGTSSNTKGIDGTFFILVKIRNITNLSSEGITLGKRINILATPYQSSFNENNNSSGGSSSGGGGGGGRRSSSGEGNSSNRVQGLFITKPSIISGTWEAIDNKWKLKISDGSYANLQWANIDNKWYLIGQDSYMQTGWQMVNNKWYLLNTDGSMLVGWQFINGKWYYMELSGEIITGWKLIGDKYYYMDNSGAMLSNTTTPDGYIVNENGEWVQ